MSRAAARQVAPRSGKPAQSKPAQSKPANKKRANLRLVDPRVAQMRARRRRTVAVSMMVLVAGMFVVAYAQARLVEGQHELDQLRTEVAEARKVRAQLERDVVEASSPTAITDRARALGMVRAADPLYIVAVDVPESSAVIDGVDPAADPFTDAPQRGGGPAVADVELSSVSIGASGS